MKDHVKRRLDNLNTSDLEAWWAAHRTFLLRAAIALMVIAAMFWLGYQFWRLLWDPSPKGAIDLKQRYEETSLWFGGKCVYDTLTTATYPPATYALLWPFLGWVTIAQAKWLWAATTVLALGWLIRLFLKERLAQTNLERVFVALIPLSIYGSGATIGNGQLMVHLLPCLLTSLLLLAKGKGLWRYDLLAACLMIFALAKPSASAAFFWIVLFFPKRLRPSLLVVSGYVGLTVLAGTFQELNLIELLHRWIASSRETLTHTAVKYSNSNLHSWSAYFELEKWCPAGSMLILMGLGVWTYCYRKADLWLLIGVTALVTRFHTYHAWYDDLLVSLPVITLFRIAKYGRLKEGYNSAAGLLLAVTLLLLVAPGGLYLFPYPWNSLYVQAQTFVWVSLLIFLLFYVRQEKKARAEGQDRRGSSHESLPVHRC